MIDKSTISKESFLLILPKTEARQLRKPKDISIAVAKWMATVISIGLIAGLVSMFINSKYIDINEFIAASMMMPTKVLVWFQNIDVTTLINRTWPLMIIAGIILLVVKLTKPKAK
jgi:hypothetical protein